MSQISCDACNNLREYAPNFVQNGTNGEVCTSLMNNTGLNPGLTVLHDNCEDLHDVNDCLIGRMTDELEAYDVCDWKDFMRKHNSNLYELLKAMLCSDCGQWIRIEDLCERIFQMLSPNPPGYGIFPYRSPATNYGTIHSKGGAPLVVSISSQGISPNSYGVGIRYEKREYIKCDGSGTETYEWIGPSLSNAILSGNVSHGDVIWSIDRATLQSITGMSDNLWDLFTRFTGGFHALSLSDHRYGWFGVTAQPSIAGSGRMAVVFQGTSYPDDGLHGNTEVLNSGEVARYTFG